MSSVSSLHHNPFPNYKPQTLPSFQTLIHLSSPISNPYPTSIPQPLNPYSIPTLPLSTPNPKPYLLSKPKPSPPPPSNPKPPNPSPSPSLISICPLQPPHLAPISLSIMIRPCSWLIADLPRGQSFTPDLVSKPFKPIDRPPKPQTPPSYSSQPYLWLIELAPLLAPCNQPEALVLVPGR